MNTEVGSIQLPDAQGVTNRVQAEAWIFQFAAVIGVDPFSLLTSAETFCKTRTRTHLASSNGVFFGAVDWHDFWEVYGFIVGHDVTEAVTKPAYKTPHE